MTDYLAGSFTESSTHDTDEHFVVRSPADQNDVLGEVSVRFDAVDEAVLAARRAFPGFRKLGTQARRELLLAYKAKLTEHADEIARTIAREIGKPLWEAKAEVSAMIGKVDISVGEATRFTQDEAIADLPGEIRLKPVGVLAVIGPFNFPGHLPNGQIVPALLLGNTVVFKPSEKGTQTAMWMARCFHEAGFPSGSFQLVQGSGRSAAKLAAHDGIDGVLFTGSVGVGRHILAANAHRPGRLIMLELGGKNASIVLDDADVERAAREIAFAGFVTAGQRCTATSRVIVTRPVANALTDRLAQLARAAVVGHPFQPGVFLGPVISEQARVLALAAQNAATSAGFEAIVGGRAIEQMEGRLGYYLQPSVHLAPSSFADVPAYSDAELFAPDLAIYVVKDLDEVLALANRSNFGLAASVFTASRQTFESAADELEVGCVHWNRSSAGASSRLPFGGIKNSGNHRPAGVMAGTSCAFPQAVLLPKDGAALPTYPGLC